MHIFGEVHVILKSTEKTRVLKLSKVPQVQQQFSVAECCSVFGCRVFANRYLTDLKTK